jgi:hypothetical protein
MKQVSRKARDRELARIRHALEKLHAPRLQMALVVALTGAMGFLASVVLLHLGIDSMGIRYPVSVVIAYLGFLLMLWCWLRSRGDELLEFLHPVDAIAPLANTGSGGLPVPSLEAGGGDFGGAGASGAWDAATSAHSSLPAPSTSGLEAPDLGDAVDLDALALVFVAIALLAATVCAAFWFVWAAPVLMAELVLDAALAAGLYRRLHGVRGQHWLRTAIRRTAWPFAATAAVFAFLGVLFQITAPGAATVGQVMEQVKEHLSDDKP